MKDKICLITGATSGIGAQTAMELARLGATIIGVGRDPQKNQRQFDAIRERTGNSKIDYLLADLSSQAQIRKLADEFKQRYSRLDVLVNNAGGFYWSRQESEDGIEMTFALNHLAYFSLTLLLLEMIINSAPARIINVSSNSHLGAELNFEDLQAKHNYSGWQAYGRSKLANVMFTYELARRLEGTGVTVNALHPGMVATNIGANNGGVLGPIFRKIINLFSTPVVDGASTPVYLAISPELEGISGMYFVKQQVFPSSPNSYDQQSARRLWELSEELTGIHSSR